MKRNSLSWKNRILWQTTLHYQNFLLSLEYFLKITSVNHRTTRIIFPLHYFTNCLLKYMFSIAKKRIFRRGCTCLSRLPRGKAKLLKLLHFALKSCLIFELNYALNITYHLEWLKKNICNCFYCTTFKYYYKDIKIKHHE